MFMKCTEMAEQIFNLREGIFCDVDRLLTPRHIRRGTHTSVGQEQSLKRTPSAKAG